VARAITLQEMNRWEQALRAYDELLLELPADRAAAAALTRRRAEVAAGIERITRCGVDTGLEPQSMAVALYRQANHLVLEGFLDQAVSLYEDVAKLRPNYADPAFPIGVTVEAHRANRPEGAYLSCRWLGESLHLQQQRLAFCCVSHTPGKDSAIVGPFDGGPVPIDYVLARRAQLVRQNQDGVDNCCMGCPELEYRDWPDSTWLFRTLVIGNHSACNQRCSYCSLAQTHFGGALYSYRAEPAVDNLAERGWIPPDAYVVWGGGEPTVSREFPSFMRKLETTRYRFNILTNATLYKPVLAEALRRGRCDIVTSVDSGTPETFYRVKYMSDAPVATLGVPAFEAVWSTIGAYAEACTETVIVKYILTIDNISDADLQGFVDLCLRYGVTRVMLSPEICDVLSGTVPPAVWEAARKAKALALGRGLRVYFSPLFLKARDFPADLRECLEITDPGIHSLVVR
jgi:tetratricopeptide (TPR) repeat protein